MARYMEEHLDMPLRDALAIIQERIMNQTTYFGIKALKNPFDHWVYQELIYQNQPDVIIEIGNASGGAALSLAHLCDLLGRGKVIGIDVSHRAIPERVKNHERITFIEGDACQRFADVKKLIAEDDRVLVIEDSSHTYQNTLEVLRSYSALLKPGDYFIVEDGICHHGLAVGPAPGPYEAIEAFARENGGFEIDRSKESFLITWNPKGYLRRINAGAGQSG
ncbi:MAG TPA: CmcI family methyltransferase [Candidatus Competibacter sp.]|nr:hypothetical protein [Candidatus Competibacteraceae bacterium]HRC72321.1 CmcI family methyltransferase [Candidatus Competibacter sp.]